jgi:hypothetical protein
MIITRFSSGYFSGTIYSAFNIPSQCGNSRLCAHYLTDHVSARLFHNSGHSGKSNARQYQSRYPSARIITGMCCLIPCFVGYDMVHVYEC